MSVRPGGCVLNIGQRSGVLIIELDHGKVNALDLELLRALIGAFRDADADQPIVLTGAGRAFSAGVDLLRISEGGAGYLPEFLAALSDCFLAVFDHPGPVVAAVNGPAIAGGCVIAAACDRRLMSQGTIGLAELSVGVPFPTSALEIMRSVLGPRTQDLILTARTVTAEQACAIGLVDEALPAERLLPSAVEQAQALARLPSGVFAFTKRQLHAPARERIAARSGKDDQVMRELWASEAIRGAIAQYMAVLRGGGQAGTGSAARG
jgi:enoyl-CoA hydratase